MSYPYEGNTRADEAAALLNQGNCRHREQGTSVCLHCVRAVMTEERRHCAFAARTAADAQTTAAEVVAQYNTGSPEPMRYAANVLMRFASEILEQGLPILLLIPNALLCLSP